MISVKPVRDENSVAVILSPFQDISGDKAILMAEESGAQLGYIAVCIEDKRMSLLKLDLYFCDKTKKLDNDNLLTADLLVRAAASYAMNRGIFVIYGVNNEDFNVFRQLGHKIIGNIALIDLPKMMRKCENCKK